MASLTLSNISVDIPVRGLSLEGSNDRRFIRLAGGGWSIRAVANVSIELRSGDRVGIWGGNGAGKSTLLKACAGWLPISTGAITVEGSLHAMLDLTQGIRGALSGRENARLRWRLLGGDDAGLSTFVDHVESFTELGDFFNLPLNCYSPGMVSRLVFAMGTAVKSDILLMDEWLGVSDQTFRDKAAHRLEALFSRNDILVIASHDRALLERVTDRIIVMSAGELVAEQGLTVPPVSVQP